MRQGVAEVDEQPIPEILRDMPLKAGDYLGTDLLIGPHHLTQVFGIELARERGGIHQITEQHGELAAFGFRGRHGGWGGQQSRGVCVPCSLLRRWWGGGNRRRTRFPSPHQHSSVLFDREVVDLNQFLFEGLQGLVIQMKLELQRPVGDPATLGEELLDLVQHVIEVH
jgi:hypothetical protein